MTSWRILVVDDEPFNLEIICDVLDDPAFRVSTAANGIDAWARLESGAPLPQLIILDRMMPGMNGIELLRRIKADAGLKDIPVIMQTAAASPLEVAEGMEAGAWYYLPKPYAPRDLLAIVRSALDDLESHAMAQRAVHYRMTVIELLDAAEFSFHTLTQARNLGLALAGLCPEPERASLGLTELLVNAVEHGNLAISYAEKSELRRADRWEQEITRRLADPVLGARRVQVRFQRTPENLVFTVTDEGAGFDWHRYLDFDPARAFDPNGRGIAMARHASFACIEYCDRGNVVIARVAASRPTDFAVTATTSRDIS